MPKKRGHVEIEQGMKERGLKWEDVQEHESRQGETAVGGQIARLDQIVPNFTWYCTLNLDSQSKFKTYAQLIITV